MIEQEPLLVNVKTVPMSQVIRPIAPVLDHDKVECLMESIDREGLQVPIKVLQDIDTGLMFSFGGCHRFEAHKRLNKETVLVEVRSATPTMLKLYLGASYQTIVDKYNKNSANNDSEETK